MVMVVVPAAKKSISRLLPPPEKDVEAMLLSVLLTRLKLSASPLLSAKAVVRSIVVLLSVIPCVRFCKGEAPSVGHSFPANTQTVTAKRSLSQLPSLFAA